MLFMSVVLLMSKLILPFHTILLWIVLCSASWQIYCKFQKIIDVTQETVLYIVLQPSFEPVIYFISPTYFHLYFSYPSLWLSYDIRSLQFHPFLSFLSLIPIILPSSFFAVLCLTSCLVHSLWSILFFFLSLLLPRFTFLCSLLHSQSLGEVNDVYYTFLIFFFFYTYRDLHYLISYGVPVHVMLTSVHISILQQFSDSNITKWQWTCIFYTMMHLRVQKVKKLSYLKVNYCFSY